MVDWNQLAEIAPVLAAGFTGKPQTFQNTLQGYKAGQEIKDDSNLRSAIREVFSLGHPANEQEVKSIFGKWGVDGRDGLAAIQTFMNWRRQNQLIDLAGRADVREEKASKLEQDKFDFLKKQPKKPTILPRGATALDENFNVVAKGESIPERPINMPPWFDSFALTKLGGEVQNPDAMKKLQEFIRTPEGQKESQDYMAMYAKLNATPLYLPRETETGPSAINARTGKYPGQETSGQGGQGQVRPKLSEDYKKDRAALGQAWDLVNTLKSKWNEIAPKTRLGGSATRIAGRAGFDPEAKVYGDSRDAVLGQLSRSIAMERGVLTNQDIERISRAIPILSANPLETDTDKEAQLKWKLIEEIIANAEKRADQRRNMSIGIIEPIIENKNQTPTNETKQNEQNASQTGQPSSIIQNKPSQADLEFTAKKYGITVEEVKKKLGIQ